MAAHLKEGVLRKKRRNRSGTNFNTEVWQDRRFVLTYTKLMYGVRTASVFKDNNYIDLSNSTTVKRINESVPHTFKVETGSESILIGCPSESECDEWMKAIEGVTLGSATTTAMKRSSLGLASMRALAEGLTAAEVLEREAEKIRQSRENSPMRKPTPPTTEPSDYSSSTVSSSSSIVTNSHVSTNPVKFTDAEMDREEIWALLQVNTHCCQKRFAPTETVFKTRYIWVNESTKEFHWSKVPDDMSQSKHINIVDHVQSVTLNTVSGVEGPNLVIHFYPCVADTVWTSSSVMSAMKSPPTSIEICMMDPVLCAGFVDLINDLRVITKDNPILLAKAQAQAEVAASSTAVLE